MGKAVGDGVAGVGAGAGAGAGVSGQLPKVWAELKAKEDPDPIKLPSE